MDRNFCFRGLPRTSAMKIETSRLFLPQYSTLKNRNRPQLQRIVRMGSLPGSTDTKNHILPIKCSSHLGDAVLCHLVFANVDEEAMNSTGVSFLQSKAHHITLLLQTCQWFSMVCGIKSMSFHDTNPIILHSPPPTANLLFPELFSRHMLSPYFYTHPSLTSSTVWHYCFYIFFQYP